MKRPEKPAELTADYRLANPTCREGSQEKARPAPSDAGTQNQIPGHGAEHAVDLSLRTSPT